MTATPPTRATRHEIVHLDMLGHVYRRPPLGAYLAQLWDRRHFILADARGRVTSESRGMLLGTAWLVLRPILDGAVYFTVFGLLLGTRDGIPNFLGYLIIGVFLFRYTSRCLSGGSQSLLGNKNLIKGFSFPRAALPVAAVLREALKVVPVIGAMILLILLLAPTEDVTWRWLIFPVVLGLQTVFNLGIALLAARATARVPDLSQAISLFSRFWLYGSAVFFSFDRFDQYPVIMTLTQFNPMFVVLDMTRDLLLYATTPDLSSWAILIGWTAVVAVGGMVFFWRGEESYGSL